MDFDRSSQRSPPPLAPSWRMILWAATLGPALLILGWCLQSDRRSTPSFATTGLSAEEIQRLNQVLKNPQEGADSRLSVDAVRVVPNAIAEKSEGLSLPDSSQNGRTQIEKSMLLTIKDNTFGVPAAEKPVYDLVLAEAREIPQAELEQRAQRDVPFAVLMLEPDRFRGELITFEGSIRRIRKLSAFGNQSDKDTSFEAWLFTDDSGLNPYRIIFTKLPDGVLEGDEITPPIRVRVTGYFFKRYSYATASDFHTAPLVIAKTFTPSTRTNTVTSRSSGNSSNLTSLAISILAAMVISGVAIEMLLQRRTRRRRFMNSDSVTPPDFSYLDRRE